jgi:transposase
VEGVLKETSRTAREALELYEFLTLRTRRLEGGDREEGLGEPQAKLLMTIPGVGAYSALAIYLNILAIMLRERIYRICEKIIRK